MRYSFVFFVVLYVVFTHINCDIKSSCAETGKQLRAELFGEDGFSERNAGNRSDVQRSGVVEIQTGLLSNEEKGKLCLKNVARCVENDINYEETTDVLSQYIFNKIPPFELSATTGVTPQCKRDSRKFISELKKFKLWALQMYDASAKLPSGLLNGNVNQFGDFDLCLASHFPQGNIRGQYCLVSMQIEIPNSPYLSGVHRLIHSHLAFKSRLEDPGHRVPRFSSINWAVCVPSSCGPSDVEKGFKRTVSEITKGTEIDFKVVLYKGMCQTTDKKEIPTSTIFVSTLFGAILLLVFIATISDVFILEWKNEFLMAFSLVRNTNRLLSTERSAGDIEVIHGVRFLNALMLLIAHKCMAMFFIPYVNRTNMAEYLGKPWTVLGRAASLYTDPFIMLSGLLTTYSLIGKLQRTNKISITDEYISRLFRILPTLGSLILFCTFILPYLNAGPLWNQVVTHHADICKQNWWRNILFIHNYFGFKDMCLTHTHHVGIDTQLFFLSPFMVFLLWKWPKKGTIILTAIAIASTILRYYVTYTNRLNNYVHFGTSVEQLFKTADYTYILPAHRITVYVIGVLLAYCLRTFNTIQISKFYLHLGNTAALCSFLMSFLGPSFMGSIDYVYNPTHAAWYSAFAPILWCASFAWVIFTSHFSHTGVLRNFLGWRGFLIWTRISYTVYLTQFPIYFYNVGVIRSPEHYGFFKIILDIKEYAFVIMVSVILTLLIEMPFITIKNRLYKIQRKPKTKCS